MQDDPLAWQAEAACKKMDSGYFFPGQKKKDGGVHGSYRSICPECPVKKECLDFAILYDMEGVWGGISEAARRKKYSKEVREMARADAIESGVYFEDLRKLF